MFTLTLILELGRCVQSGDLAALKKCLKTSVEAVNYETLQEACDRDSIDHLKYLLKHNMNINKRTEIRGNLLIKSVEAFDVLMSHEIPKNRIDVKWQFILSVCGSNRKDIRTCIQKLCNSPACIKQGCEGENERLLSLKSFLFECIANSRIVIVECIIECVEYFLNTQDENGRTPIVYAAEKGIKDIVEMLAKMKPDISVRSNDGKRLIDYIAGLENKTKIVEILDKVSQYKILYEFVI